MDEINEELEAGEDLNAKPPEDKDADILDEEHESVEDLAEEEDGEEEPYDDVNPL